MNQASSEGGNPSRGVWGHDPPENFEILVLWNAISSVLRGQILSKMFSKSIVLFTSAEREVKDSRRLGMYQSYNFLARLGTQSL